MKFRKRIPIKPRTKNGIFGISKYWTNKFSDLFGWYLNGSFLFTNPVAPLRSQFCIFCEEMVPLFVGENRVFRQSFGHDEKCTRSQFLSEASQNVVPNHYIFQTFSWFLHASSVLLACDWVVRTMRLAWGSVSP